MNGTVTDAWNNASANARIFKPLSILCIVFGHFHAVSGSRVAALEYWWNVSAMALIYFTVCSAYFTHVKYRDNLVLGGFWKNKARRLGAKMLLVNGFLLALFVLQGREHIWSAHSLVNIFGLTGFLNWFGVRSQSPFGAGLWFLTLLFLFYAAYPWLRRLYGGQVNPWLTLVCVGACLVLDRAVPVGHTLWLTAAGYFVGLYLAARDVGGAARHAVWVMIGLLVLFVVCNAARIKIANGFFLVALASAFFIATMRISLRQTPLRVLGVLDSAVLEIFMLHTYLFVFPTRMLVPDFVASLAIICVVAVALAHSAKRLARIGAG